MENLLAGVFAPLTGFVETHAVWAGPIVFAICFLECLAIAAALERWMESMPPEHRSLVSLAIIAGIFFAWRALRRRD